MKTKYLIILIVLITVSMQAQIPTLAERKSPIIKVKKYDSNFIIKKINFLNQKKTELNKTDTTALKINEMQLSNFTELKAIIDKNEVKNNDQFEAIYQAIFVKKTDSINELIKEKINESKKADNVQKVEKINAEVEKLKEQIRFLEYDLKTYTETHHWFPSTQSKYSRAFFKQLYNIKDNKTSFLNSFALNYNDLGAVVQSEILGDTFRSFRVSFGTVLQSNAETPETEEEKVIQTEEDQLDELLNGGGNFYLETQYPVYYNQGNICSVYGFLNNKTALSLKGLNETIDSETFNTAFGVNFYVGVNSDEKKFNVFFKGDVNVIIGSKSLYQNLQLADEKPFLQGKVILGVTFLSKFRLAATLNSFGSDDAVRRNKVTVGLQIIP